MSLMRLRRLVPVTIQPSQLGKQNINCSAAKADNYWRRVLCPLSSGPLSVWKQVKSATELEVIARAPLTWIFDQHGLACSEEMEQLPPVDFVLCRADGRPTIAIQLVHRKAKVTGKSAMAKSRLRLLVGLLNQTPMRTFVWSSDTMPSSDALRRMLAGLDVYPATAAPATRMSGERPLTWCSTLQTGLLRFGKWGWLGRALKREGRNTRSTLPRQAWVGESEIPRLLAALDIAIEIGELNTIERLRLKRFRSALEQRGVGCICTLSTTASQSLHDMLLKLALPAEIQGDLARLAMELQRVKRRTTGAKSARENVPPAWPPTELAPLDVRELDFEKIKDLAFEAAGFSANDSRLATQQPHHDHEITIERNCAVR